MTSPGLVLVQIEQDERERWTPAARAACEAFGYSWDKLKEPTRERWREVAKALDGTTPARRRGKLDAYQDRCEGCPPEKSVPHYIPEADRAEWTAGYHRQLVEMHGEEYAAGFVGGAP